MTNDAPPTWQEEVAAVEDAFERSGVWPTWPDDEPGNIGPMAAAMADEIARLRLTDAERYAVLEAAGCYVAECDELQAAGVVVDAKRLAVRDTLRVLLNRMTL